MQTIRQPTTGDIAKLMTLGAIWASAFMCIEVALVDFPPLAIASWRIIIGALALAPLILLQRGSLPSGWRIWRLIFLAGVLYNAIPFSLISWGQQFISSSTAAIVMSCGPFIALALSHYLTPDDRFNIYKLAGVILGFLGVLVLIGVEALDGSAKAIMGQLAMVGAVTCYILSSLVVRRITGVSPSMISLTVLVSSCLYMMPVLLLFSEPLPKISDSNSIVALLFLGLVPTAFAYILRIQIAQQVGSTFLSQVSYVIPPFGLFWSWLFLGQIPSYATWLALVLILGGMVVSQIVPAKATSV